MESSAVQSLYYSNERGLEVEDVADSLLAFKALLERTPDLLAGLFPTISVQSVSITVESVSAGSLLEDLLVKIVWGNQEELSKDTEKLRTTLNLRELLQNKMFLAALLFAMVLTGGLYTLKKNNAPESQRQVIQGNQNNVVVIASQLSGLPSDAIADAVTSAVTNNPAIAKEATRLVNPAKREEGASITAGRGSDVAISPEAVRAMPAPVQTDEEVDSIEDMSNVEVQIRAVDLDSTKRGWAAIVPVLGDRRIKVHLDLGVDPNRLMAKKAIRADVTVVFRREASGSKIPSLVYIRRVRK
jgi:hypothetical protein